MRIISACLLLLFSFSTNAKEEDLLMCLPERFWTCDGLANCYQDPRPDTLAGWKIDIGNSRYTLCNRAGSKCASWKPMQIGNRRFEEDFYILHDPDGGHPETFKYDPTTGKFVADRLSGGFQDIDLSESPPKTSIDWSKLLIRTRVGSCVEVGK